MTEIAEVPVPLARVIQDVINERLRQLKKHGDQSHLPDGTGPALILDHLPHIWGATRADNLANWAKARCKAASQNEGGNGTITYEQILTEEWAEAIAEEDPAKLRAELIQIAAVAVAWVEKLDKKGSAEDYDLINVDVAEPVFGAQVGKKLVRTHGKSQCRGPLAENGDPICCIHNPSDHHMVTWPQNWRADKGMMERTCSHGVGHPDPDDLAVRTTEWAGVHGCDGCCIRSTGVVDSPDATDEDGTSQDND